MFTQNRYPLLVFLFSLLSFPLLAQNVGIGTATPLDRLHVNGSIRSDALASADSNVVLSDVNGRLINLDAGSAGDILVSQGAGRAPAWSTAGALAVQSYGATATRTFINSTSFIPVGGLSVTVNITSNSVVQLSTYGSLETTSAAFSGSGCIVQIFQNGVAIPQAFQTVDVNDAFLVINTIQPWSFATWTTLAPGTYTFTVRARKYAFDDFYAGGNFTAPNPNEGALLVTVFPQ